ncbi:M24 family metallopeptidase [Dyella sp. LX-66]|uniref:aminopeptidase P family protein n=1 Tax=unclassified Dyella TaxID=2634549 RepID=UPI001BE07EB8|nr:MULTISPECIES: aminopeptidase P family protein [unclassified Dyella]MBT2116805.1 M24 family metallopeptidase [Dyella sp. LX-1]MBT2139015.1 M24 family metallopeptidase [Dyella sp. LX-66]
MSELIPPRLALLRQAMRRHGVDACLVPSADPHLSEYLPAHWQARSWLSGFTGSAGTLVVTADWAALWTDSRYFAQAERELAGTGVELMRQRTANVPEPQEWLRQQLHEGQVLAVAGDSLPLSGRSRFERQFESTGARLRTDLDLPGEAWTGRPPLPAAPVTEHPIRYACITRADKLARLRTAMRKLGASHHLVSSLDDVAWLTNLRGSDVECNPVFLAHLLVAAEGPAVLFVDRRKLTDALVGALAADGVRIADYATVTDALGELREGERLLLDAGRVACAVADAIAPAAQLIDAANPSTAMKARKSAAELDHVREVMRRDGAALSRAFRRLEERLAAGMRQTELDVHTLLREERSAQPDFVGESFATIAGYQANGALPHYRATPEHHSTLKPLGLLLVDSGGQYLGGTTDVTRVLVLGETTAEQRRDATLVLKGLIALSRARFPKGASGPQLDALARAPLWASGMDYGHGTGHGVGYFLNVHEGPQSIRPPTSGPLVALEPGMISSIEPGLYKPGRHGIRHENLAVVAEADQTEFGEFHAFETLTMCPFDRRALEPGLLNPEERAWLDDYHARVRAALSPLLEGADLVWLERHCAPL